MTYLSDTARVVLAAAAQRDDLSVLPFPDGVKAKGGAEQKVLAGLKKRGFVRVIETPGRPQRIVITREGMAAIGVEPDDQADRDVSGAAEAGTGATSADAGAQAIDAAAPAPATEADGAATSAKTGKAAKRKARVTKAVSADKPTPRSSTKQAKMIEMLRRPEGATVEQIAAATRWQHHTIRGVISGALKKKLGLTVEATRTREVGPNKAGAKGSATVYRITGPTTGPQPASGSGTEPA
jgi:Protein of unknown function (DUF3489)